MKLYYAETIAPQKVCAVAKYLGSPIEYVHVDLGKGENRTPAYLAINPNGKVPALVHGNKRVLEADAINAYLARAAGSDLWPTDDRQIEVLRWLSWNTDHFTRHGGALYFEHRIKRLLLNMAPDAAVVDEATGYFKTFAGVLNDHLRGRKYLLDETLTIADFAVGATLPYAAEIKLPLAGFSEVERWHARLNDLPAWRQPFPEPTSAAA